MEAPVGTPNRGYVYHDRVLPDHAGLEVGAYHRARGFRSPPEVWIAAISEGRVRVNGRIASPDSRLCAGDRMEYHREPWIEESVPLEFGVVHADLHVLVLNKPAGLQVLPAGAFLEHTLFHQVRAARPEWADASPIHRLGRGTSGLIVFGVSPLARAELARQFRCFVPRKTYLARAQGTLLRGGMIARHPIGGLRHGDLTIHVARPDGKPCTTRLRVLRSDPHSGEMLVAAQPITGRPDQIRVHLAALGAPIVGDPLFGPGGLPISNARPGEGGYFLHATALAFVHPITGRWLKLRAWPPWLEARP